MRFTRFTDTPGGLAIDPGPSAAPMPLRQIIGIGRNYPEHAREQGLAPPTSIVAFGKSIASLCLDGEAIRVPKACQDREQVDFEGELAVIIGRAARDVSKEDALRCVMGYACANDVSARWWQKEGSGGQFYRGKSFDTFCPIGPRVALPSEVENAGNLRITTRVNGKVMQEGSTRQMSFDIPTLISELSKGATLVPGTVILTGTPSGVGMSRTPSVFLKHGDLVEVEIERIGALGNRVVFE